MYRPNVASGGQSLIRRSQGGVADRALQLKGNVNFVFPPGRVVIAGGYRGWLSRMVRNRNFWGSSPFLDYRPFFFSFLAHQSRARAKATARARQLLIGYCTRGHTARDNALMTLTPPTATLPDAAFCLYLTGTILERHRIVP